MKLSHFAAALSVLAFTLTSCGDGSSASSSDLFGNIVSTQNKYEAKKDKLEGSMNESNYKSNQEEIDKLKEAFVEKIKADAAELSGKEIAAEAEASQLTIKQPLTLKFEDMNHLRPLFGLAGKVVAATDINLNVDPADLKGEKLLDGSKVTVSVTMPVSLDILDKDGNVLKHIHEIGVLAAENLGTSAVVKAGTPVDFRNTLAVDEELAGASKFRLAVDLTEAPYTSHGLK